MPILYKKDYIPDDKQKMQIAGHVGFSIEILVIQMTFLKKRNVNIVGLLMG